MAQDSRTARLSQSIGGMLLTILVVLGLIAVVAIFTFRPSEPQVRVVEFQGTAAAARSTGAFDVAVPDPVPDGWLATSVRYTPSVTNPKIATWHLGFYIPPDDYVGIEQTNGTDPGFVAEATNRGKPEGQQVVDGQTWKRYFSEDNNRRALVLDSDGIITVVTGTLNYEQLGRVAASLKTQ